MAVALWVPVGALASTGGQTVAIIVVALIAAMPTFFEIPLALILLSADFFQRRTRAEILSAQEMQDYVSVPARD